MENTIVPMELDMAYFNLKTRFGGRINRFFFKKNSIFSNTSPDLFPCSRLILDLYSFNRKSGISNCVHFALWTRQRAIVPLQSDPTADHHTTRGLGATEDRGPWHSCATGANNSNSSLLCSLRGCTGSEDTPRSLPDDSLAHRRGGFDRVLLCWGVEREGGSTRRRMFDRTIPKYWAKGRKNRPDRDPP